MGGTKVQWYGTFADDDKKGFNKVDEVYDRGRRTSKLGAVEVVALVDETTLAVSVKQS